MQTLLEVNQRQVAGPHLYSGGAGSSAKEPSAIANRRASLRLSHSWMMPRRTESHAGFVN